MVFVVEIRDRLGDVVGIEFLSTQAYPLKELKCRINNESPC